MKNQLTSFDIHILADELNKLNEARNIRIDKAIWDGSPLDSNLPHDIYIQLGQISQDSSVTEVRSFIEKARALGSFSLLIIDEQGESTLTWANVCSSCGLWIKELKPSHFNFGCPECEGKGCVTCHQTGLYPEAAAVRWQGLRLPAGSRSAVLRPLEHRTRRGG